jgi:hypothetical protein
MGSRRRDHLFERLINRLKPLIRLNLAGHVDEPFGLGWVVGLGEMA